MKSWSREKIALLKSMWAEGQTAAEIANMLGLSPNAVGGKIYRLGLPKRGGRSRRRRRVLPAKPIPVPVSLHISILELRRDMCRWPYDNDIAGDLSYCGHPCAQGYSYCPAHALIAYRAEEHGPARKIDIQLAEAA